MYIVRYADDFKFFTNSHKSAIRIYHAVRGCLKDRLHLDISPDKSTITNPRRNKSEFLGFPLKATKKRNRYVANTSVSCKKRRIRQHIINIQKSPTYESIAKYNTYILEIQNYYRIATHVTTDFRKNCLSS